MAYTYPSRPKAKKKKATRRRRKAAVVRKAKPKPKAATLREWLESLEVTQGRYAGERLQLLSWEVELLRALDGGAQIVAVSMGRGNGKTTMAAGLGLAAIAGPAAKPRSECTLVAASFSQAKIAFDHALFFGAKLGIGTDRRTWRVVNSSQLAMIEHRPTGARLRVLGSEPRRLLGLAPSLVLCDEPAAWGTGSDAMYSALRTSLGKLPGAQLIAIGTRPADPEHWFSKLLGEQADAALLYSAESDADPLDEAAWQAANPSLPHFPDLRAAIAKEAELAAKDPTALASFRALRLNCGTADVVSKALIDAAAWRHVIELPVPDPEGELVIGVDAGGARSATAVAGYWPACGRLCVLAAFGTKDLSLEERGRLDGVGDLYRECARGGELLEHADSRVGDLEALLTAALERWGAPRVIVADRWRSSELRDALDRAQIPVAQLVERGQGFHHGGVDTRAFVTAALSERVRPGRSVLLAAALGEATVVSDAAGNHKLTKRRSRSRDDAAAAAVLAVAEGSRMLAGARPTRRGRLLV